MDKKLLWWIFFYENPTVKSMIDKWKFLNERSDNAVDSWVYEWILSESYTI